MAVAHGFKHISFEKNRSQWRGQIDVTESGKRKTLNIGRHATPEEAAHHVDILLYLLYGDEADFNLPDRMTPELRARLDGYADVHAYLAERKAASAKRVDEAFRSGASRFRGVAWNKRDNIWKMSITTPKRIMKTFKDEEEAARAYDRIAIPLYGRAFADRLNFPLSHYVEAGEFTEEQLDEIDARVAAGKPAPAAGAAIPGAAKGKAKPKVPPRRRSTAATAAAAAPSEATPDGTAAAAAAPSDDDDDYSDYDHWSSEGEEELVQAAASRARPITCGGGFFRVEPLSDSDECTEEEYEQAVREFEEIRERAAQAGIIDRMEAKKQEFRELRLKERDEARAAYEAAQGTPGEEVARMVLEEQQRVVDTIDEHIPSDAHYAGMILREGMEANQRWWRDTVAKYPLAYRVLGGGGPLWSDDGKPNLFNMYKELERIGCDLTDTVDALPTPEARMDFLEAFHDASGVFLDLKYDASTPVCDEHYELLLNMFHRALPRHLRDTDSEGKEGWEQEQEEEDGEGEDGEEYGEVVEDETEDEEGSSHRQAPRRLLPESLALEDMSELLAAIVDAAQGQPVKTPAPAAGNAAGSAEAGGCSAGAGAAHAGSATTASGGGYTPADYRSLLDTLLAQEGKYAGAETAAAPPLGAGAGAGAADGFAACFGGVPSMTTAAASAALRGASGPAGTLSLPGMGAPFGSMPTTTAAPNSAGLAGAGMGAFAGLPSGSSTPGMFAGLGDMPSGSGAGAFGGLPSGSGAAAFGGLPSGSGAAAFGGLPGASAGTDPELEDFELKGQQLRQEAEYYLFLAKLRRREWELKQSALRRNNAMLCTYWEGLAYAHFHAGNHQWLEDLMGPGWKARMDAAAQPDGPRLFGVHGGIDTYVPGTVPMGRMFAEMTGAVPTCILSEGLAGALALEEELLGSGIPELDGPTLDNWYAAVKEQVQLGVEVTGLLPGERFAELAVKAEWPQVGPKLLKKIQDACFRPARTSAFVDWGPGLGPNRAAASGGQGEGRQGQAAQGGGAEGAAPQGGAAQGGGAEGAAAQGGTAQGGDAEGAAAQGQAVQGQAAGD